MKCSLLLYIFGELFSYGWFRIYLLFSIKRCMRAANLATR
jgi:hypothetical protein